jgi:solute carrier family 35 protein E1
MVASVLVFRNPVSLQAGIGSFIGISGVLLYSLTKQHYEQLEAAAAAQEGKGGRNKRGGNNKRAVANNNKNRKQAGNKTKKR